MTDRIFTADASKVSGVDFLRSMRGLPPLTSAEKAKKQAEADAYWARRREQSRRELEQLRENLCALVGPETQAKFRKQWAEDDRRQEQREERRASPTVEEIGDPFRKRAA